MWLYNHEDKYNWQLYIDRISQHPEIPEDEKAGLEAGWRKLSNILGDSWISSQDAVLPQHRHPFLRGLQSIFNPDPDMIQHFAYLGEKLNAIQGIDESGPVLDRVRNMETFESAMTEIDAASRLLESDLEVCFIPTKNQPTADLEVKINGKKVFVEITNVGLSLKEQEYKESYDKLHLKLLTSKEIEWAGKLTKPIFEIDINKLIDEIEECFSKAWIAKDGVRLQIDGAEFCFASPERTRIVEQWKHKKGMDTQSSLTGVDFDIQLTERIQHAIRSKRRQIGKTTAGAIYVEIDGMLYIGASKKPLFFFIPSKVRTVLEKYQNILFIIIVSKIGIIADPVKRKGEYDFSVTVKGRVAYGSLVITNRIADDALTSVLVEAFLS